MKHLLLKFRKIINYFHIMLVIIINVGCSEVIEQIGKDVKYIELEFEKGYTHKDTIIPVINESVVRNAMIIYLMETSQIDSISIDFYRLMIIQDSLNLQK